MKKQKGAKGGGRWHADDGQNMECERVWFGVVVARRGSSRGNWSFKKKACSGGGEMGERRKKGETGVEGLGVGCGERKNGRKTGDKCR